MLERLTIVNFQKHRRLVIDLDRQITTIIGRTESGKSTIIRALRWLCLNRAPGRLTRHGADKTRVSLVVDGREIVRAKGISNFYKLDGKAFKAIGNKVPEEIAKLLNLSDYNFQQQLDPHFWFSDSAGAVSKELNRIVNLELIDSSLGKIASEVRGARAKFEVTRERLCQAQAKLVGLSLVPRMHRSLRKIEAQQAEIEKIRNRRASVAVLIDQAKKVKGQLGTAAERSSRAAALLARADAATAATEEAKGLRELVEETTRIIHDHTEATVRIDRCLIALAKVKECPLCSRPI